MAASEPPERFELPISWVGLEETPISYANQFLIQYQPDGSFVLAVGVATPPALIGRPDEVAEQMADVTFVPVRTLTRVVLSPAKLKELIATLQANLDNVERIQTQIDRRNPPLS
jgi:hypothetical protein